MKIECNVIKDLMVLDDAEGCSPESLTLIEDHVKTCASCKSLWKTDDEEIVAAIMEKSNTEEFNALVKKVRMKTTEKIIAIAALLVVAIVVLFFVINYFFCSMTVPYDENRFSVEIAEDNGEMLLYSVHQVPAYLNSSGSSHLVAKIEVDGIEKNVVLLGETTNFTNYIKIMTADTYDKTYRTGYYTNGFPYGDTFEATEIDEVYYMDRVGLNWYKLQKDNKANNLQDQDVIDYIEKHGHLVWTAEE